MSKKQDKEPEITAEFDLKHRITGAAVLLFLGVLVLPLLLGPPSKANKVDVNDEVTTVSGVEPANILSETDEPTVNATTVSQVEETVYISKITPLDAQGNRGSDEATAKTTANKPSEDDANALQELVEEQKQKAAREAAAKKAADEKAAIASEKAKASKPEVKDSKPKETADEQQAKREKELQAALAAEIKAKENSQSAQKAAQVDVGWVVQVGLFTDKNRAVALIGELKKSGFNASSSVVDTNRGANTGTRVWLGPFDKRVAAINEQKRLKSEADKEGFIRVYP